MNWLEDTWTMHRKNGETSHQLKDTWMKYRKNMDTNEEASIQNREIFWNNGLQMIEKRKQPLKCVGWVKEFSQSKTIMIGWHQARTMNLEENGARFKRNSSSVFTCWEWWWEPPWQLLRHSGMKIGKVEPTMKRIWKILEKDIWLMITHSYVKLWKEF